MSVLLSVEDLRTEFRLPEGTIAAPDGISFSLNRGEILGVVGESGSGKSVTALSILGLVPNPPGRVVSGRILFDDRDLRKEAHRLRGREISMVFQNPLNSLNPALRIGRQLTEVLEEHTGASSESALARSIEMMQLLGIPDPQSMMRRYPFEYSGGMRQRIMVAMAMLCSPKLLIADEPTTALDATIQAQMLHLFESLRSEFGTSIIYITHDLSVVSQLSDRIIVMYAGHIVEEAPTELLFRSPSHPYTQGLIRSIPGSVSRRNAERKLPFITGNVPNLLRPPAGCRFHPRCPFVMDRCRTKAPPDFAREGGRVWCWLRATETGAAISREEAPQ